MKTPKPPRLGSSFEPLEDRTLPTTFGVPWADPGHLTLSFAADGTPTPLGASSLAATLASAGTSAEWKREVLRAFQTWAMHANINVGLVSDGGQALGSVGAVQGDSRFGDVRVAAAALSPDVLASASPFSWTGTTFSGDVVLNANVPYSIGGAGYDLFSVALHEAGHALGLDHDDHESSALHAQYARTAGLSADDLAAIRALYGAREHDAFDAAGVGNSMSRAGSLARNSYGQLIADGDVTTLADVDYFKFHAPLLTSALSGVYVRLKTEGLSLLNAKLTVLDAYGRVVRSAVSTDPLNNDLMVSFRPGLFGGTYYVKVEGAKDDAFGVGSYKLGVDFLSVGGLLLPLTTTLVGVVDAGTNDLLSSALGLPSNESADARFDATYRGVIESSGDVDYYRVRSGNLPAGTAATLNVMVWGLDADALDPRVRVYDSAGNPVAFEVLSNDRGLFSVQVRNAVAGRDYFVQVAARDPGGANRTGDYFLAADFNTLAPLEFDGVGSGTVASGATEEATLTLSRAGLFQFALGADSAQAGAVVTMSVYDADGNLVFSLSAVAGQPPVTAARYLTAGVYTVRYTGARANTAAVGYGLYLLQLSEGVGPYATTTSTQPSSSPSSYDSANPPPPSSSTQEQEYSYTYSGSTSPRPSGYYYTY